MSKAAARRITVFGLTWMIILAGSAQSNAQTLVYDIYQITTDGAGPNMDLNPTLNDDGDIAWEGSGIEFYDYSAHAIIPTGIAGSSPALNNLGQIAYSAGGNIFVYDTVSTATAQITNDASVSGSPKINDNGDVAFVNQGSGSTPNDYEIFLYVASSGSITNVSNDAVWQRSFDLNDAGDVVFLRGASCSAGPCSELGSDTEIWFYDRSAGTRTRITTNAIAELSPNINNFGDMGWFTYTVTIWDARIMEVVFRDGTSGVVSTLTDADVRNQSLTTNQMPFNDVGDFAMMASGANGIVTDIYAYDAATGSENLVAAYGGGQPVNSNPVINVNGWIAWASGGDIYLAIPRECVPEVCDGEDNDCNGLIDDGIADEQTGTDVGECQIEIQSCIDGSFQVTQPGIGPTSEACDGLDNDCNGATDDGVPDQISGSNVGECQEEIRSCIGGTYQLVQVGVGPTSEACDALDNDCDGVIDNGIDDLVSGTDVGECQVEIQSCVGGSFQVVQSGIGPGVEVCDGLDNDCNGVDDVTQGICNTPPSSGSVEYTDPSGNASLEFPDVSTGGDTTVQEISCSVNVPDGYTLNTSASCYEITSTADSSSGEKVVCIQYPSSLTPAPTALLKCESSGAQNCCAVALNGTGTTCTDGTYFLSLNPVPPLPPAEYEVCISVNTLSDFAFAQLDAALDSDFDSVPDVGDNCPADFNPLQEDGDTDGLGDACDNCAAAPNGPGGGTCTAGDPDSLGRDCSDDVECGAGGFCSRAQQDDGADGVGDACDPTLVPFYTGDIFVTPDCYFQGGCAPEDFPVYWGVLETFEYGVPPGNPIADVRIQGTWGNDVFGGSAPAEIYLEGILVTECVAPDSCWDNAATEDWNGGAGFLLSDLGVDFSDPGVQALFADGSAALSAIQNDLYSVNVSDLKLTVYAPEPGTLASLAVGALVLVGLSGLSGRRGRGGRER